LINRRIHKIHSRSLSFAGLLLPAAAALLFCVPAILMPQQAHAQAQVSASQRMTLSAFGGATYTFTGLYSNGYNSDSAYNGSGPVQGKSTGITAGVDLRVGHFGHYNPTIEVRGSYPIDTGNIDSTESALAGLKIERPVGAGRIHPYVDFLYGRGELDYHSGGYYTPSNLMISYYTDSNILSPGAGVDFDLTHHLGFKLDAQYQHYNTPAVNSGAIWSLPVTAGVIYIFDFNPHHRR
jgi:hypothetical protein